MYGINNFTIPSEVAKIEEKVFYRCKNLRYILVKTNKLITKNVGYNVSGKGILNFGLRRIKASGNCTLRYL